MPPHQQDGPVAVVLGTRPEIIKLARIVELLGDDAHLIHTGQHYDTNLADQFFGEFGMRTPDTTLDVGGRSRGAQIGMGTTELTDLFTELRPSAVVVQGDTNAVTAGCLAANAVEVPLIHVEAGLRSFDRRMPEEHNRIIADHLADVCLAATDQNVGNLAAEGIAGERVVLTGNPIVEAVERLMPPAVERDAILRTHDVEQDGYVLGTFHRPENVDRPEPLNAILAALGALDAPVVLPLHPRTRARIGSFGLDDPATNIRIVDPVGYREFLALGAASGMVVSDSGGVQEEVSVYKRPAVVIRRSTERQEVEGTFVTRMLPDDQLIPALTTAWQGAARRREQLADVPSPYGDTSSPQRCVDAIRAVATR
ncbi:MAG: UDP-N-acetylglucosamine 2-epimerase (non-hydrolyzing) [Acidimicrobiia bacterium]|nr:UDP-N-acetylglucosamine 2-epimerase (non-hydrolyzing) [Acidimicrobiia bacterium]